MNKTMIESSLNDYLKRGFYNTIFYALSAFFSRFFNFLFFPLLLSHITLHELAMWDIYQTIVSWGTVLVTSCPMIGMVRFFIFHRDNIDMQKKSIGNTYFFSSILAIIVCVPHAIIGYYFFAYSHSAITIINISISSLFAILLSYMKMTEQVFMYAILFCSQSCIATALTLIGVCCNNWAESLFYAHFVSYILFIPGFFYIFSQNMDFCFTLAKKQLHYSFPFLIHNFLYMAFAALDRFFLAYYQGTEAFAYYAFLFRFGAFYQFGAMILMEAWPILLFNAQKETDGSKIISSLVDYYIMLLCSGCIVSIISVVMIVPIFFKSFVSVCVYVPLFFCSLAMLEIARLMATGIGLSNKTGYIPLITLIALSLQALHLYFGVHYNLLGVLSADLLVFCLYAFFNYKTSCSIYISDIINGKRVVKVLLLFFLFLFIFQLIFERVAWYVIGILCLAWPAALYYLILQPYEKLLLNRMIESTVPWFKKGAIYNEMRRGDA